MRVLYVGTALIMLAILVLAAHLSWGQGRGLNFERERAREILNRVAREIEKNFYDPGMRGLEWKNMTTLARQHVENAKSLDEVYIPIFALVAALKDSHTRFLPPGRTARPLFGFEAKAFGDEIRIYELEKKGAAAAAGLQVGDRILGINGYRLNRETIDEMQLDFRILRPVTAMDIVYARGSDPPRRVHVEAKIKRYGLLTDLTKIENIYQLIREADSSKPKFVSKRHNGDIGYLYLPYFPTNIDFLRRRVGFIKKARAVIIDLRGNPGGAVSGLKHFCGFFETESALVGNMLGRKKVSPLKITPKQPSLPGPMFVLMDSQSSSAAEVFARHFQRSGRAVVIGDRSSGRVTIARFLSLQYGLDVATPYGLSVAVARLVFSDGEELENHGVEPDHMCIPTEQDLRDERDPCLDMALDLARKSLETPPQEKAGD